MFNYERNAKKDFNLLPKRIKASSNMWNILKKVLMGVYSIVGICIIASFYLLWQITGINGDKAKVEDEIVKLKPVIALEQEFNNERAKLTKIQDYYKTIANKAPPAYNFLREFEEIIPKDVTVNSLNYTDSGKLDIIGVAKSEIAINDLLNNLKRTQRFSEVFLSKLTKNTVKNAKTNKKQYVYSFSLGCKFSASQPQDASKTTAQNSQKQTSATAKGGKSQ